MDWSQTGEPIPRDDLVAAGQLTIKPYRDDDKERWDAFVASSKNGTFLFNRDYLDHHADRFPDASLIAEDEDGDVRALLPGTRQDHQLISHAGLTYGGFVSSEDMTLGTMLDVFNASLRHLQEDGVTTLLYKSVPHIYHRRPAEEDLYALFVHGAELYRRDVLSVISYGDELEWKARRRRGMRKATRAGVEIRESEEYERFWPVLEANLKERYGTWPAHSLEEIRLLARRFPAQIHLYEACLGDELEAGVIVYVSDSVCHVQYNAASPAGRDHGALDLLFGRLIEAFRGHVRYFDFGISTEQEGRFLNTGLVEYKQHFGARAVAHDFYRLPISVL